MRESTKNLLLSLVYCSGTILGWGFTSFTVNLRAYRDENRGDKQNQPMGISLIFAAIGIILSDVIFLAVWPQRPFKLIKRDSAIYSAIAGVLYGVAMWQYIVAADEGVPASIEGPIAGLHVLVPPVWYVLFYQECLGVKTIIGFILSLVSLVLFSGVLSEAGSFTLSMTDWFSCFLTILGFGIGLIFQDWAGEDFTISQFPQTFICLSIGYAGVLTILAFVVGNVSDIANRSYWVPFGVEQILTISPTLCAGLGTGFFSMCLKYGNDLNIMVALTSLNIDIPALLGIVVLKEPATWNVLLGVFLVVAAIMILSLEAKQSFKSPSDKTKRLHWSPSSIYLEKIKNVDKIPLLFEPCLETSIYAVVVCE